MANANVLVPGTGGVTLLDNFGNDVGWPVLMRLKGVIRGVQGKSNEELIELLGMEHRPGQLAPAKTSLKPGTSLLPGSLLRFAYNQLDSGFNVFRYDWRADLRYSAANLLDFLRDRQPANGRWNIVGHSQGGLLIVLASKLMDAEDEFARYVATVTLVGAPVAGTLNAAHAMIVGDNAGARLAPVIRKTIRMWPSIYQMLPAWDAVLGDDGAPAPSEFQLDQPAAWAGVEGIDEDLLLRAREAQVILRNPFSHMQGVDVRLYLADNRTTTTGIRRWERDDPGAWKVARESKGDTLVPYATTMEYVGETVWPHVTRFVSPCEPHAYMLNDPTVVTHLKRRLA